MEEFKVGDWVRKEPFLFEQEVYQLAYSDFYGVGRKSDSFFENLEPWQPKEGEWCWFYTNTSKGRRFINPQLGKFQNLVEQDTNTYKNGYRYIADIGFYKQCEPFIGELPTFLKET